MTAKQLKECMNNGENSMPKKIIWIARDRRWENLVGVFLNEPQMVDGLWDDGCSGQTFGLRPGQKKQFELIEIKKARKKK